jgi:hypothetical protein
MAAPASLRRVVKKIAELINSCVQETSLDSIGEVALERE